MEIKSKCAYCGVVEFIHIQYEAMLNDLKCHHCNQPDLQFSRVTKDEMIDSYAGCPPFPEKKAEEKPVDKPKEQPVDASYGDLTDFQAMEFDWNDYMD